MDIEKRKQKAAESILENESLREGLDDSGASALLNWGTTCAKFIASETGYLENEEAADEISYPRMYALREMLDVVKSLHQPGLNSTEGRELLAKFINLATLVYGPNRPVAARIYWNVFAAVQSDDTGGKINALRSMIEKNFNSY